MNSLLLKELSYYICDDKPTFKEFPFDIVIGCFMDRMDRQLHF